MPDQLATEPYQNILPREILRWLGMMDLTLPIKLPRRSFANGYIIGEILSRYYPKDIPIHGMETGSGKRSRISNWGLLEKIFAKKGINIPRSNIDRIIEEIPGAAEDALQQLYEHVTKKNLSYVSSSKEVIAESNAPVRIAAPLKPKPGAQVVTTSAAVVLLSLDEIPSRIILIWELVYSVTNIGDWDLVNQDDSIYDLNAIMEKLKRKTAELNVSFRTDSRVNLVRFFNFLLKPFLFDVNSFSFRLAMKIFSHLLPILHSNQPKAGAILLEALENYSPWMKIPSLELKLGHLAHIFGQVMETSDLDLLQAFKTAFPVDIYTFFLAGLHSYTQPEFWFTEVQSLVLTLMEGNVFVNESQLHCAILLLMASLAQPPWSIYTSTMQVYLSKLLMEIDQEKTDAKVYCLAEVACVMLQQNLPGASAWYPCVWAARQLRDPSMLLCLIQKMIPLLKHHTCLSGTLVRFLTTLPSDVLVTALKREVSAQAVPYLRPKSIGAWENLIQHDLKEKLTMGLAAVTNEIDYSGVLFLVPFLVTETWTTNAVLLNASWILLLENVDTQGWQVLQLLCTKIPASHSLDKSILLGMMAALAHHMRHRPSALWLRTAVHDVVNATQYKNTLWGVLCRRLYDIWATVLPQFDLNTWAKSLQDANVGESLKGREKTVY